ncbi:exopolysaccharide export protein EpsX [Corallococcus sp. EGB]|uniref:exopolysaccharide export protein EpsX n=1 Tax=Corallococcus sp. EGB TaxID=1521117 RepID=UPI001CBCD9DD|nr:exopolysaccharide export protein EpsX [Corallococcus sp. EGB]
MLDAALASVWLEVASASVSYGAAARVDTRARSMDAQATGEAVAPVAADMDLVPTLSLKYDDGSAVAQVQYAPRISFREATTHPRTEVQHVGRLLGDWRPSRGLTLHGTQEFVLGQVNLFTNLPLGGSVGDDPTAPGDTPPLTDVPIQPLPEGVDTVFFLSSLTTLAAETVWLGPGWRLSGSLGFSASGGLDDTAKKAVPFQYGPRAQLSLGNSPAPRHTLATTLAFTDSRFSTGARASVTTLTGAWTHRLDRRTSVEAGVGVGVAYSVRATADGTANAPATPDATPSGGRRLTTLQVGGAPVEEPPRRLELLPDLTLAVSHRVPSRTADFNGRLAARVTPFVDRLTGLVYPRADLTLNGTWALSPRFRFSGTGGGAFAVGGAVGDRQVVGGVGAGWTVNRWVTLEVDTRAAWTRSPDVEAARTVWSATLGLTFQKTGIL